MKTAIKSIVTAVALYAAGLSAAVLPRVSTTDTVPNQWTSNMSGVLEAAKTTNLPILLVMINDSSAGQGCQHCMQFVNNTLNTENFANIVNRYQFYMVLLNYWSSPREPAYGGVSEKIFDSYFNTYQSGDNGYPQVVVIKPNGTRHKVWSYKTRPVGSSGSILYQYIEAAIAELAPSKAVSTVFSLTPQSGNTVTVQAPNAGVWTGVVTRSGESGKTGSVAISLEGANKALYELSASSLAWDAGDGTKTFTVTGPKTFNGGIVSDDLTVRITASGFSGSDVSYGTSSQTVTFKDSRVKQSLSDFAAAHTGVGTLSSSGGTWYVPAQNDGNVLETVAVATSDSTLVFTASAGGILQVALGTTRGRATCTTSKGVNMELATGQPVRFGVAAGDKITFTASGVAGASDTVVGFSEFSFSPLTVTLSSPAANAEISYSEMMARKSLVDFAWSANQPGCTFALTCGGVTKNMGTATSGNALDLGLVSASPETKTYPWSVQASYSADDLIGTAVSAAASSSFKVASLPVYDNTSTTVIAYKSLESAIDMSVNSSGVGEVTYSATGLPKGMKIDAKTGVITGSPKQIKDLTVTVTAQNAYGSTSKTFTLKVQKFPRAYSSPKYAIFYFNGNDEIVAAGQLKLTSTGKWSASIVKDGSTTKLQGEITSLEDGSLATGSSALNLVYDINSKMWTGTASGYRVYGRMTTKAGTDWKGNWSFGLASSSNAKLGGWVTVKVGTAGKITTTGRISNTTKISGGSLSAVFPESFVRANLPRWAGRGDVRFGHASTRTGISMGCALFANGSAGGHVKSGSQVLDIAQGSHWNKALFAGLNGKNMVSLGGGDVTFPIALSGKKPSFNSSRNNETISSSLTTGQVKISYKISGKTYKASGAVYSVGGQSKILGGGTHGGEPFVIKVE